MYITAAELMVTCIAHQIEDNEVVVQGIATPLITTALMLARHTHAPNLYFASAIGQSLCKRPAPVRLAGIEKVWLDRSMKDIGFISVACDFLPSIKPKEFFRPAQVDPSGNFNNIAIGKNYSQPRLRLPGTGGIPDVTTYNSKIYLYVPRHSRITFVEKLDFLSGLGHHPARTSGHGTHFLISDLGVFDFVNGRMRLVSYHPGVEIERIQARTGFELEIAEDVHETLPPTSHELHLIREVIDLLGIRDLELLSGATRREKIMSILAAERNLED